MSDAIYRPLIEDMRWSYSRITSFERCPYGWFLHYIHGSQEDDLFYSSFGSFMHKLLERYYKGKATPEELESEFFINFSDKVKGERPKNISNYIEQGSAFLKNLKPLPYRIVGVEERVKFQIEDKTFVGVIDLLCKSGDEYIIIDHKSHKLVPRTGKKPAKKSDEELDQYLRQLYLYSAAVEQKYGKLPTKLCFNCFMNNQFIEEPFVQERYEDVKKWAVREIRMIEGADEFYPLYEWFYCKNICGQHENCCYFEDWKKG